MNYISIKSAKIKKRELNCQKVYEIIGEFEQRCSFDD